MAGLGPAREGEEAFRYKALAAVLGGLVPSMAAWMASVRYSTSSIGAGVKGFRASRCQKMLSQDSS